MIIDRASWGRLRITGGDRLRFLQGLTTVNVELLGDDGSHAWGAILNPKGRVLSVIDIARAGDALIVACEASLVDSTRALLERYAVMDEVEFEAITGPAHQVWGSVGDVWTAPIVEGDGAGAIAETDPDAERMRIRAGFVRYGADVDDDHFPFETPLVNLLDYQKGCYVGQEPVFRVHAQGNAARALRGLVIEGSAPISLGATLDHPAKSGAGKVTSSVGDGDRQLALGYLHRTAWEPGATVQIGDRTAVIHALPMDVA